MVFGGCSKPLATSPAPAPSPTKPKAIYAMDEVRFELPSKWTAEDVQGGVLLLAPTIEADWQANMFLEIRGDLNQRPLEAALADYVSSLRNSKSGFRELQRSLGKTADGLQYALVEYECQSQGAALTQREIILPVNERKRLFILASSASSLWDKYRPIFDAFLGSLTLDA